MTEELGQFFGAKYLIQLGYSSSGTRQEFRNGARILAAILAKALAASDTLKPPISNLEVTLISAATKAFCFRVLATSWQIENACYARYRKSASF